MDRVNRIIIDPEFEGYLHKIDIAEEGRLFCSHHFDHLLSTARLTWIYLLEGGSPYISREIAYAAGFLHDIGRWREYRDGGDHADYSAELAKPLLRKSGFSEAESGLIIKAIKQHRDSYDPEIHRSPLSLALNRADKHSRLCFTCNAREVCNKLNKQPHKCRLEY
ncbi:MAG: HD domain-containing protein [Firmicutes bacterium]|nr:HD domain-containing protein [Bacillota bacterium]